MNTSFLSDQQLVEQVLHGNIRAFPAVIAHTEKLVAQIVRKMISNEEDQKDIVQEVYLKTFQRLNTFRFQAKLSTWVGRIAFNTCCNYLEKKKIPLSDISALCEDALESGDNTESILFTKELSSILKEETDRLPLLYKTLITLYHGEQLHNTEISEITSLPEGTIKSYLYRARNMLRKNIERRYKNEML